MHDVLIQSSKGKKGACFSVGDFLDFGCKSPCSSCRNVIANAESHHFEFETFTLNNPEVEAIVLQTSDDAICDFTLIPLFSRCSAIL